MASWLEALAWKSQNEKQHDRLMHRWERNTMWILTKQYGNVENGINYLEQGPLVDFSEHNKEPLGSINIIC